MLSLRLGQRLSFSGRERGPAAVVVVARVDSPWASERVAPPPDSVLVALLNDLGPLCPRVGPGGQAVCVDFPRCQPNPRPARKQRVLTNVVGGRITVERVRSHDLAGAGACRPPQCV